MKKNDNNQSIKCDVVSCKFNDEEEGACALEEIQVSSGECDHDDCSCCDDTVCESFEKKEEISDIDSDDEDTETEESDDDEDEDNDENEEEED